MLQNGRGLIKALENWAKKVTADYKDVDVRDLSTSFRDGLAFCAIIHHYRPDLMYVITWLIIFLKICFDVDEFIKNALKWLENKCIKSRPFFFVCF